MNKWTWLLVLIVAVAGCQKASEEPAEKPIEEGASDKPDVSEVPKQEEPKKEAGEHAGWLIDFEKAKSVAREQNKHILIDFSGSDWCGWCIKLDEEVFQKDEFKAYADENLVLMLADFPSDKSKVSEATMAQNEKLAKEFGVRGFPTVFILAPDGSTVGKTGYQAGGPEAYIEHLKKIMASKK